MARLNPRWRRGRPDPPSLVISGCFNGKTAGHAVSESLKRFNLSIDTQQDTLLMNMLREAAALTTQIGGEIIPSDRSDCLAMAVREAGMDAFTELRWITISTSPGHCPI